MTNSPDCGYYSESQGLLAMVERGCARLMKAGGGPLGKDYNAGDSRGIQNRSTAEQRETIFSMASTGKFSGVDIARAVNLQPDLVRGWLRRRGFSFSSGRCAPAKAKKIKLAKVIQHHPTQSDAIQSHPMQSNTALRTSAAA